MRHLGIRSFSITSPFTVSTGFCTIVLLSLDLCALAIEHLRIETTTEALNNRAPFVIELIVRIWFQFQDNKKPRRASK